MSHERSDIAGAESFYSLEGNMCGTAMRGADALPGSNYKRMRRDGSSRHIATEAKALNLRPLSGELRMFDYGRLWPATTRMTHRGL